jgi:hypothetical protein
MAFCLTPQAIKEFATRLKNGEIDVEKLSKMTSEERRQLFMKFVDETTARETNALLEQKLLQKNVWNGIYRWIEQSAGLKPEVKNDLFAKAKKAQEEGLLTPENQDAFLEDLVAHRLGTQVTLEQAGKIAELSKQIGEKTGTEQGLKMIEFDEYVNSLVPQDKKILSLLGLPRAIMSSGDISFAFRQGWGMVGTKEFWQNFGKLFTFFASEKNYKESVAKMITDPDYKLLVNNGKLAITKIGGKLAQAEEAFQSHLAEKYPLVRASNRSFTGFANALRFDRAKALLEQARLAGEDVRPGSDVVRQITHVVNAFTGRGELGKGDKYAQAGPLLSAVFFSPRKIMATVNMFDPRIYLSSSPTARKAALRQMIGSVGITTTVLALAKMAGGEVETDPRSSDFGKIKIGNTRIEVTGGNNTYATFIARLATNQSKSSTTGNIYDLGRGYKPTTRGDLATKFARNKLAPVASLVADWLYGSNAIGEPFNLAQETKERVMPMVAGDVLEMINNGTPADLFAISTVADLLGLGIQTYSETNK